MRESNPAVIPRNHVVEEALAAATARGEWTALVDTFDRFDPEAGAAAGIALPQLLWVRGQALSKTASAVDPAWVPGVRGVSGPGTLLEPGVWLTAPAPGRITIGAGCFLNLGVMVAAHELVEIGDHCMFANGCFVTDANHRFDDPEQPITWQGFTTKGPTRIGDNVWCGANVVVTSGVTIGERSVIGANSVVTTDIPPYSIAAGAPAKVLKRVEYDR
jgi:acetyltransferase-like isoleucine patch superfamily enzyme